MKYDYLLDDLKKEVLVFDIETSAFYPDGKEVNLKTNYDDYIKYAQVKWFGAYSYKYKKGFIYTYKDFDKIQKLFREHSILVGFNSEEFDFPICKNNFLINENQYYTHVDAMQILGKSIFKNRSGFKYKDRGTLMNYKFKNNSLKTMAEEMGLETQKGEINYKIFAKESWNSDEEKEIKKYLKTDVLATKQMFEKLWEYWLPFTDLLDVKFIKNLSWIRNSIASLTYKCACSLMEVEPTYSEHKTNSEEMGGRVILPKMEEAKNVWYIDFASLYPHVMTQFNLFAETCEKEGEFVWHGNDLFKVKGYYNISKPHPLNVQVQEKLKERIELKKNDKNNPMIYCLKIFLNALYGAGRSSIFEQIHTKNFGWDVCWLGQQIQQFTEKKMKEFGFETIAGDTDSLFVHTTDNSKNNREHVLECLSKIVKEIKENVPFPVDTFSIDIEAFIDYIMFPFSLQPIQNENGDNIKKGNRLIKERKGKKKNYLYIYTEKDQKNVKLVGLPIKKDNATALGIKIYHEVLEPLILKENTAKFDERFIKETVNKYLQNDEIMKLISREFKVKPYRTYKNPESQLQAQISKEYFNENDGIIRLIKNNKIGKVGKGQLYCTVQEAIDNKLTIDDLNLDKLWNELEPFIANT